MAEWCSFDKGASLGRQGSEGGVIIADEEWPEGARITLERGGVSALWAITCGVYDGMVHTRFFDGEAQARAAYSAMKEQLQALANMNQLGQDFADAVHAFIVKYP